jgi:hypothetical protein
MHGMPIALLERERDEHLSIAMTRNGANGKARKQSGDAGQVRTRRAPKGPGRRHKRYRTQSLQIDNPVVGRVVNVGQLGLALESVESLAVGQTYIFKVRLGEKFMRLAGRIQWCRLTATEAAGESEAKPIYKAGVALVETVTGKAWQEALRRMTEGPAHIIWHRARTKTAEHPLPDLAAGNRANDRAGELAG